MHELNLQLKNTDSVKNSAQCKIGDHHGESYKIRTNNHHNPSEPKLVHGLKNRLEDDYQSPARRENNFINVRTNFPYDTLVARHQNSVSVATIASNNQSIANER